jgi:hypothetical protein
VLAENEIKGRGLMINVADYAGEGQLFRHSVTGFYHVRKDPSEAEQRMKCGRMSDKFISVTRASEIILPRCATCFGQHGK